MLELIILCYSACFHPLFCLLSNEGKRQRAPLEFNEPGFERPLHKTRSPVFNQRIHCIETQSVFAIHACSLGFFILIHRKRRA